jgi:hypothetical protein
MSTSNARESTHSRAKGRAPTRFAKRAISYLMFFGLDCLTAILPVAISSNRCSHEIKAARLSSV